MGPAPATCRMTSSRTNSANTAVRVVAERQKFTILPAVPPTQASKVQLDRAAVSGVGDGDSCAGSAELSSDADRVEVPFAEIAPPAGERWTRRSWRGIARSHRPLRRDQAAVSRHSAKGRASTRSSRAKPAPANPLSSTSSSPTWRCGAARRRSSFISSISKRASSSSATPRAICLTPASSPSKAIASSGSACCSAR